MNLGTELPSESRVGQGAKDDAGVPQGDIFDVLSNARRRCALHYIKQNGDRWVELRELVDYVAAWENDTSIEDLESSDRKCVYTALRQSHLPRMEEAGIIEYDTMRGDLKLTPEARQVELYLERVPRNDITWGGYYLGLSAVSLGLVSVTWSGIFPFSELSGLTLSVLLAGLFVLSAAVHTYQSKKNRLGSDRYELES